MKKLSLLIALLSLLIFSCKKDNEDNPQPGNTDEDAQKVYTANKLVADARSKFLELAPQTNGDPKLALMQTLDWAQQQSGVADAFQIDSIYLFMETTAGLTSMFWFNEVDANGNSKYRGSGSGQLEALIAGGNCANLVENKDVMIYSPAEEQFRYDFESNVPELLQSSSKIDNLVFVKNEQASIAMINTFPNYGLVLMETHGTPISFLTGNSFSFGPSDVPTDYIVFRDEVLSQIGQEYFNHLLTGKLVVGGKAVFDPLDINWWSNDQEEFEAGQYNLWATPKLLDDIPSLSNTIVLGNFCFSGWTAPHPMIDKPIGQGFMDKNPITYYAYQEPDGKSKTVLNLDCIYLEDSLIRRLITDGDNTGIAHLKANGSQFQTTWPNLHLVHMGQPDWCYGCDEGELIDGRDGQEYRTVKIGDQTWMAENLRYLPAVHTNSEFADAADNETPAYGVYGYSGTSTLDATAHPNYEIYGVLYNWYATDQVCPGGWHLPTKAEWLELAEYTGLASEAGGKLKSQDYWDPPSSSTNEFCFSAVPGGSRGEVVGDFRDLGVIGYHWTSTDVGNGLAKSAGFSATASSFQSGNAAKGAGYACRCVKD